MTENVAQRVPEEFTHAVGFEDYIFEQMSRRLADRVLNKILEGECVCKFVEKSITEERCTDQIEYRMGVDIRPLVRCKDCKHRRPVCPDNPNDDFSVYVRCNLNDEIHDRYFFCADGKEKEE